MRTAALATTQTSQTARHRITDWNPEDTQAWEAGNKTIARRNLACTIIADHAGFSIFALWSVMAMFMPHDVYGFSGADKFLLGATATFVGGCARVPYSMAVARFGGRNWTVFSSLVLLIPTVATIALLANPGLPLWPYLVCAALTGLGGANFAASMAHVNAFYPQRLKGWALAANAGLGNSGAAIVQVAGLMVLAWAGNRQPYWVCAIYLVFLVVAAILAAVFMDNLDQTIDASHIKSALKVSDSWAIMLLYICTFGSWVGLTFAFSQVMSITFQQNGHTPAQASLHALQFAFIGPLSGSLSRLPGGTLSDRKGGGRVTLAVLVGMAVAAGVLVVLSSRASHIDGPVGTGILAGFIAAFIVLFVLAGIGNASVFKMIPSIFEARSRSLDLDETGRRHWSHTHAGALIGLTGAVGAFGGVGINLTLRHSYQSTGTATSAFWVFVASYLLAAVLTWVRYVRRPTKQAAVETREQAAVPADPAEQHRPERVVELHR